MVLNGIVAIHAPRKQVWDFLTDPNQIGQCLLGGEKIESFEPNKKYQGVVAIAWKMESHSSRMVWLCLKQVRQTAREILERGNDGGTELPAAPEVHLPSLGD
jgi:carbon monoxide dehydrogenase subunit G